MIRLHSVSADQIQIEYIYLDRKFIACMHLLLEHLALLNVIKLPVIKNSQMEVVILTYYVNKATIQSDVYRYMNSQHQSYILSFR